MSKEREKFRKACLSRSGNVCTVPWCDDTPDDVHHIIERKLWEDGGYIKENGAPVCSEHHRYAESNHIPPQAFWKWIGLEPTLPDNIDDWNVNKWGDSYEKPSDKWKSEDDDISTERDYVKQPSTVHLPFSKEDSDEDNFHNWEEMTNFVEIPLVVTVKMDGSNCYVSRERVASRKGWGATHDTYDHLKAMHSSFRHKIPENLQIFGEWLKHKHSIHYTNEKECDCEDSGPALESYLQIFNVYDNEYNLWLSWPEVEEWANTIGFPTTPVIEKDLYFENEHEAAEKLRQMSEETVEKGHEGIVVRPKFPFHYGKFDKVVGKYVRNNHVKTDEHWMHQEKVENQIKDA